jgi:hypothetical protein
MLAAPFQPNLSLVVAQTPDRSLLITALQLIALVSIVVWAARVGYRTLANLAILGLLTSIVALWSATRIEERIWDHQVFWLTAIGALNLGLIVGASGLYVRRHLSGRLRLPAASAPLACGALIATCVFICFSQLERARAGRLPSTLSTPVARRFGATVREYLSAGGIQKPLFRIGQDVWGMTAGVLLELNRSGVPFAVEDSWMPMFPQAFAATGHEDVEITASRAGAHLKLATRQGNVLVTSSDAVYFDAVPIAPTRR